MKLSVVQFTPQLFEIEKNKNEILSKIERINSDFIVFPELATSGYFFLNKTETENYSEPFQNDFVRQIQEISSANNKIIVFGFAEEHNGNFYNSVAIILPERDLSCVYRKIHLFYKEQFCFEVGDTGFFVLDYKPFDLKFGVMICYDWRFPESARTLGLLGADLIVIPSNLITNLWTKVMPARAIENKTYLAVANRCGTEERENEKLIFNGKSGIWDYEGNLLAGADSENDCILTADIQPKATRNKSFNEFNDIFKDRKVEFYKL